MKSAPHDASGRVALGNADSYATLAAGQVRLNPKQFSANTATANTTG